MHYHPPIATIALALIASLALGATTARPPTNTGPVKTPPAPPATAPAPKPTISMDPGYQTNVPLPNSDPATAQTCELYIPQTAPKPGTRRPVLFVLGRSYSKNAKWIKTEKLTDWADQTGAIIIGVNQLFIATPPVTTAPAIGKAVPTEEAMDPYMALADSLPGISPIVRLVVTDEANLTDEYRALAVAQRYTGKVAGLVLGPRLYEPYKDSPTVRVGLGTGVAILSVTWEAYAKANPKKPFVTDIDDPYDNLKFESTIGDNLRAARIPINYVETDSFIAVKPDKLHTALNWLLEQAWLQKPGTNKEELAAAKEDLKAQFKAASSQADAALRENQLRDLLLLPGVPADEGKSFLTPWRKSVLDAADTRTELLFKDIYLKKMAALPIMKGSPESKLLGDKLAALEADPKCKLEIEGEKKVRDLASQVGELGIQQKSLDDAKKLDADFLQLVTDYPDTLAAREAKDWSDLLERRIKNTAARPVRSKR